MSFEPWTSKDVEYRLLEASRTQMLLPWVGGPAGIAGVWPEYALDYKGMNLRRRPSAEEISRMEECWSWINGFLAESERKTLYAWLYFKSQRGRSVGEYAEKSGMNSKTLRRAIIAYCQRIADNLNKNRSILRTIAVDQVSEILAYESADSAPKERLHQSPTHTRAPDAKPRWTGSAREIADVEKLIKRIKREMRRRRREERRKGVA